MSIGSMLTTVIAKIVCNRCTLKCCKCYKYNTLHNTLQHNGMSNCKKPSMESKWVVLRSIPWHNMTKNHLSRWPCLKHSQTIWHKTSPKHSPPRISYLQVSRFFCRAICSQFPRFHTVPKVSTDHSNKPRGTMVAQCFPAVISWKATVYPQFKTCQ